jgi:glycosyltransferase involved in cell wall biosynthesis
VAVVSIVVPAYNYARFLPDALDSVLAQTFADWECLIVDDGSTDETPAVAQRYVARDARFRYVRQDNRGLPAARNLGIRETGGKYLQFLDADDKLAPAKLEIHERFLDQNPGVDLVYSLATFFRTEEPEKVLYSLHGHLSRPNLPKVGGNRDALRRLQQYNLSPPTTMFARRTIVDRAGFFNESARACEDWDYWLRCAIAGCEIRFLDAGMPVAFIRTHRESMSRSSERMIRGLIDAASTFHTTAAARQWTAGSLPAVYEMAMGVDAVEHGRRREGIRRLWTATRAATSSLSRLRWAVYTVAASLLPRRPFVWVVTRPMPERGLELIRWLRPRRT